MCASGPLWSRVSVTIRAYLAQENEDISKRVPGDSHQLMMKDEAARVGWTRAAVVSQARCSLDSLWRRSIVQAPLDASAKLLRYCDSTQLGLHGEQNVRLERVLARARGAGLEVFAHDVGLVRRQLPVEELIHAAKGFLAPVPIQWRHDAD